MNKPDSDREYPYVDDHEFNCDYIKTRFQRNQVVEEKPDDLQGEA